MTAGRTTRALLLLATLLSAAISVRAQELEIAPDRPSGVYATGQKATWKVALKGGEPAAVKKAGYVLKKGGLTDVAWGEMDLSSGAATVSGDLAEPGTLLLEVKANLEGGKTIRGLGGA